ncbi:MAG TPA: hypothetical protein VK196_12505 [Magnetospirillum sp.]|nr:hypothetical protein [Magnetospirillum sp.]
MSEDDGGWKTYPGPVDQSLRIGKRHPTTAKAPASPDSGIKAPGTALSLHDNKCYGSVTRNMNII